MNIMLGSYSELAGLVYMIVPTCVSKKDITPHFPPTFFVLIMNANGGGKGERYTRMEHVPLWSMYVCV